MRLQADHVNRSLIPAFYRYLQAQDPGTVIPWLGDTCNTHTSTEKQIEGGKELFAAIEGLVNLFERGAKETDTDVGLWQDKGKMSLADVMAAPRLLRSGLFLGGSR